MILESKLESSGAGEEKLRSCAKASPTRFGLTGRAIALNRPTRDANTYAELYGLTVRVKLIAWPYTSPEVVLDVTATWESYCANGAATRGYKPSMLTALSAVIDSLGFLCEAKS